MSVVPLLQAGVGGVEDNMQLAVGIFNNLLTLFTSLLQLCLMSCLILVLAYIKILQLRTFMVISSYFPYPSTPTNLP